MYLHKPVGRRREKERGAEEQSTVRQVCEASSDLTKASETKSIGSVGQFDVGLSGVGWSGL